MFCVMLPVFMVSTPQDVALLLFAYCSAVYLDDRLRDLAALEMY